MAGLPVGFVGLRSALYQGQVAVAGINILAKKETHQTKGIIPSSNGWNLSILAFVMSFTIIKSSKNFKRTW